MSEKETDVDKQYVKTKKNRIDYVKHKRKQ